MVGQQANQKWIIYIIEQGTVEARRDQEGVFRHQCWPTNEHQLSWGFVAPWSLTPAVFSTTATLVPAFQLSVAEWRLVPALEHTWGFHPPWLGAV